MRWMQKNLPDTHIILNKAKAKNTCLDENGQIQVWDEKRDINTINTIWKALDEYAEDNWGLQSLDYEKDVFYLNPKHVFGAFIVHFEQKYYNLYFKKLCEACADFKPTGRRRVPDIPIIKNLDLKDGIAYWNKWDDKVFVEEKNSKPVIVVDEYGNTEYVKRQCWSDVAEINGDGEKAYRLTMKIRQYGVDRRRFFFCIRTFAKKDLIRYCDSIESIDLNLDDFHVPENKDTEIEFVFKPHGKYMKIGPLITQIGHVEYSEISLKQISI